MKTKVLIAEDDQVQRQIIEDILASAGYAPKGVASGSEALDALASDTYGVLLTDMRMPEIDGLELLQRAKRLRADLEVVVMTAHATVETAITAMKEGALDYLAKPFDKSELLVVIAKAVEQSQLRSEHQRLHDLITDTSALGNIIGESEPMRRVFDIIQRAVPLTTTVLIRGESGTGKELVARHIHYAGQRRKLPFVVVNCAAIPDNLVESELFGHEKGAFTGAETSRPGKFETADGGTLFLDEIGDMRLESQAKLLRVLQDGLIERVGGAKHQKVDVRVIAATNCDLAKRVENGRFREDLYFRLDVLNIKIPPLRDRVRDLALLVSHFRQKIGAKLGRGAPIIGPEILDAFSRYRWPGNVRELENTLEQMFILSDAPVIGDEHLPEKLRHPTPDTGDFTLPPGGLVLEDLEQALIRQALDRSGGRLQETADLLGLSYKTLQYRLRKHDIDRKDSVK